MRNLTADDVCAIPHTCNAYCAGATHGWLIAVPSWCPEARRRATLQLILLAMDYRLVAFRPAPEAAGVVFGEALPYLAIVEPMPYGDDDEES